MFLSFKTHPHCHVNVMSSLVHAISKYLHLQSRIFESIDEAIESVEIVLRFRGMCGLDDSIFRRRDDCGSEMSPVFALGHGRDVEMAEEELDALQQTLLLRLQDPAVDLLVNVCCRIKRGKNEVYRRF